MLLAFGVNIQWMLLAFGVNLARRVMLQKVAGVAEWQTLRT